MSQDKAMERARSYVPNYATTVLLCYYK